MVELYEHQRVGVDFLRESGRAILADEMGLGKTVQAITAAGSQIGNVLIVCPASIKINWKREIERFTQKHDTIVVSGRKTQQWAKMSSTRSDRKLWFIVNYDILANHVDWLSQSGIQTMILDESHYIKGRTKRAEASIELAKKIQNVYCLTGTPILNRPIELFNQLRAIGHPIASGRTTFARRYCGAFYMQQMINRYDGRSIVLPESSAWNLNRATWTFGKKFLNEGGATNLDELREKIKGCFLRRKKIDVIDLPPKIISVLEVEMTPDQRRDYDTAWQTYIEKLILEVHDEKKIQNTMGAREIVELTKLKQACSYSKIDRIVSDVINAIDQYEKVIVFSQYTYTIEQILEKLRSKKIGAVRLTGQDNEKQRQQSVDSFENDGKTMVFVANIKAGGVGLNLTKASIVIFADMEWSPELHGQAEDRAHRIGQRGTVNVYYYVCKGTVEEDIMELLTKKKQIVQEVIDGNKKRIQTKSVLAEFTKRMSQYAAVDN